MTPSPGETLELDVTGVAYRGAGIARHCGIVAFIRRTLPGERVLAQVEAIRKNFIEARLVEVLRPSPDRVASECLLPDGAPVPGCAYDYASHAAEVALKEEQLRDFLRRLNLPDAAFLPPFFSPNPLHYRNKATFHVSPGDGGASIAAGYFGDDNKTVVDVSECPLAMPEINAAWAEFRASLRRGRRPRRCAVTLRRTEADGVVAWTDAAPPPPGRRLLEHSPVGDLLVPCDGFFQVNPPVAAALVEQVRDWVSGLLRDGAIDVALDLCCGVGPFALAAAQAGVSRVVGVETSRQAVKCARANAERLSIGGTAFYCRDAAEYLSSEASSIPMARAVAIADPPRAGLQRRALDALCASPLRHAIFVSCDPATLARDLSLASAAGFSVRAARLFDMFPRTAHFESAILLER